MQCASICLRSSSVMPLLIPPGIDGDLVRLFPADSLDDFLRAFAHLDNFSADLQSNLLHYTEDVPLGCRCVWSDNEIGTAECVEMGRVIAGKNDIIEKLPKFLAGGSDSTWNTASQAFTDAMWCASGQTPQIRVVMRGISSTGRPTQNCSNPRSSGIWKYVFATSPSSFRKMSIFPWPSSLVIGSILICFIFVNPS